VSYLFIDSDLRSNKNAPLRLSFKSFLTAWSFVSLIALNTFWTVLGLSGFIKVLNTCSGSSLINLLINLVLNTSDPSLHIFWAFVYASLTLGLKFDLPTSSKVSVISFDKIAAYLCDWPDINSLVDLVTPKNCDLIALAVENGTKSFCSKIVFGIFKASGCSFAVGLASSKSFWADFFISVISTLAPPETTLNLSSNAWYAPFAAIFHSSTFPVIALCNNSP